MDAEQSTAKDNAHSINTDEVALRNVEAEVRIAMHRDQFRDIDDDMFK